MIATSERTVANGPAASGADRQPGASQPISVTAPWLLTNKVTPPARTPFYVERAQLVEGIERASSPIVMLRAPGGFGKTTLLSEICRREKERGNLAAWLTLDEEDTEEGVGMYLTYAFERAGLPVAMAPNGDEYRTELLVHEIESRGAPCLLVIDEVERLKSRAVEALDYFLHRLPGNLRVVLGMRTNPGLDLSTAMLERRCMAIGASRLRFSKADVASFFDGALSRRELAVVVERTQGWPVALGFYRILRREDERGVAVDRLPDSLAGDEGISANWLGVRLLRSIGPEDREFLLDLSQFDWIEPAIVDEALDRNDSGRRLADLVALQGLLQQLETTADTWQLHPLLKELCIAERQRGSPERFRQLHRAIAAAMLERGRLLAAVRHAGEAGDWELVGSALTRAGGLRLLLREGTVRLGAAQRFLTGEVQNLYPRLALLRCRLLVQEGKITQARALYGNTRARTGDFSRDRPDGDDRALRQEALIMRLLLIGYGCTEYDDELVEEVAQALERIRSEEEPDPPTAAMTGVLLFAARQQRAQFELGSAVGDEAEANGLLCNSHYVAYHVEMLRGLTAMAEGRSSEAEDRYVRAAEIAGHHFPLDSAMVQAAEALLAELGLERGEAASIREQASPIPMPFRNVTAWLDVFAAAHEAAIEWRFESGGLEDVLSAIDAACDWADSQGLEGVTRHLLAVRVGHLAAAERVDEANGAWLEAGFPEDPQGLLDLDRQSWREMEAISCARLRLLIVSGRLDAARELGDRLARVARERGLMRTLMRCLALSMLLEHRAGDADAALARLTDLLRLHAGTGYARPLIRERGTTQPLLERLLGMDIEPGTREAAEALRRRLGAAEEAAMPEFTPREREILEWLGRGRRDKEIARHLDLTVDGVRYHLKNIYRKTGASGRGEAVSRARAAGVIS